MVWYLVEHKKKLNFIWYLLCWATSIFKHDPQELTRSMVQDILWKVENSLLSVWNPKVRYRVHKSSILVPVLSQRNPVQKLQYYFVSSILILSSHVSLGLPIGILPLGFLTKILYECPISFIRATCSAHPFLPGVIILIIFGKTCAFSCSSLWNFF